VALHQKEPEKFGSGNMLMFRTKGTIG